MDFETTDLLHFPQELHEIIQTTPAPSLDEGRPHPKLVDWMTEYDAQLSVNAPPKDGAAFMACRSGLWLLAGELGRSHSISQELKTTEGSYWHAIMHRREGDFWNAKYWFRQLRNAPIFPDLAELSSRDHEGIAVNAQGKWDAQKFVDLCEQAIKKKIQVAACQSLATHECRLLLRHCWKKAWTE
jgi:hypothetical protein